MTRTLGSILLPSQRLNCENISNSPGVLETSKYFKWTAMQFQILPCVDFRAFSDSSWTMFLWFYNQSNYKNILRGTIRKPQVIPHVLLVDLRTTISFFYFSFFANDRGFLSETNLVEPQKPYSWKSVSSLREKFFLQDQSSFESNAVTKPVVTQATTRHQMKDMDIIFPLIPLNFLWVKQFGYCSLSKSSIFSKR